MRTQLTRQKLSQSRQHGPIGPGRFRLPDLTTQNLHRVPEREYLDVVHRRCRPHDAGADRRKLSCCLWVSDDYGWLLCMDT